ncbi:MAG: DegT/DnrJ/EryC1/StrS family aminotransferase [Acidimicrobiales bacterium]|nr:DegT/DnrJ/EryC1/StrS family aminotransferase [Acidimicrobiales bacterium]
MSEVRFVDLAAMHDEVRAELDAAYHDTLSQSAFIGGAALEDFEHRWASYCERTNAVGVANGTDALTLGLRASGIGAGDEVIVPANTFIATAEAVALAGAEPVFVDVDADTLLLDVAAAEAAIGPRTAAVIAVHLYGQVCDMDALNALCQRSGVLLVEDAAQAHGARWNGRRAGSFGLFAAFSFYPGKNLGALGDGGAVVTDEPELADKIRSLGNHGRDMPGAGPHLVATNSRLDAFQARALTVKLAHLDTWNAARRRAAAHYERALAGLDELRLTTTASEAEHVHHLFVVRTHARDALRAELSARGIQTGIHYNVVCHRHPAFEPHPAPHAPVAEDAAASVLSLPLHPHLADDQIDAVVSGLHHFFGSVHA